MYANTISWSSPTTPLPMEINPRAVFERLFGQPETSATALSGARLDRSILDVVARQAHELQLRVGPSDRVRLDQYLDNLREIERRIQRAETFNGTQITTPDAPMGARVF